MMAKKVLWLTIIIGCALLAPIISACPLSVHSRQAPTLHEEVSTAEVVLVVRAENARKNGDTATTDLVILEVLKGAAIVEGKKKIQVPGFIDRNPKKAVFLVFGEVYKGKLDVYRGLDAGPELVAYVKQGMAYSPKERPMVLRYWAEHFGSETEEISTDVLRGIKKATDAEIEALAKKLDPAPLRSILRRHNTNPQVLATAAFLLGHCGDARDKSLVGETMVLLKKADYWSEDVLKACVLLDSTDGENHLVKRLRSLRPGDLEAGSVPGKKFSEWYQALRAARYFHDERRGVIGKNPIEQALEPNLQIADVADFIIEDYRRWKLWDKANSIIALADKKSHQIPIVRRSILRYALDCPEKVARDYVAEQRRRNPDWVSEIEENLELDKQGNTPP